MADVEIDLASSKNTILRKEAGKPGMDGGSEQYLMQERIGKGDLKDIHVSEHAVRGQDPPTDQQFLIPSSEALPFLTGWKKGVATGVCGVLLTLVINVVVIIAFIVRFGIEDGVIVLYQGECDRVSKINLGIHLLINGLGTLLLSASNYCMQVLSAPTRQEVDRAHTQRQWLDIGLSSVRNLFKIRRWRVGVWMLLVISSLPLHLVYNSVVFTSIGAYQYTGVVATPTFVNGPLFQGHIDIWTDNEVIGNSPTLEDVQKLQADSSSFEKLNNSACIEKYHRALVTDRSDLILISSFHNASDEENNVYLAFRDGDFYLEFDGVASWMCNTFNETAYNNCFYNVETPDPGTWSIQDHPIDYCLSRPTPEVCKVKSSLYLMIIVIICNVAKLTAMLITLFTYKDNPLVTVGDAVSSFMDSPDDTTLDACLLSKNDVVSGEFWAETTHIKTWKRRHVFRFGAVSRRRWWLSVFFCFIGIIIIIVFLDLAIAGLESTGVVTHNSTPSLSQIWAAGFGLGDGTSFWNDAPRSLYGNILLANLPQLIFSIIYFVYNGLYTVMSLAVEWSYFSRRRKGLRVSRPVGAQRSTYYLQLPYTYAVPLILASGLMHWFISQSFYLLSVDFSGSNSSETTSFASCGYSPIAIIFALALAVLMLIVILLHGFRRIVFDIPPVGSCSTAISAACHAPTNGQDASKPLQWGVVMTSHRESDVGHCSFSSGEVMPPVTEERYGRLNHRFRSRVRHSKPQ